MQQLLSGMVAVIVLALAMDARTPNNQNSHSLSRLDVQKLVAGPLALVNHWKEVPRPVRDVLSKQWKSEGVADPGEPFRSTCTGPSDLPSRRLILAAHASGAWLVCYESGGIAQSFNLEVIPFEADAVRGEPVSITFFPPEIKDLQSLRRAVREHRY